MTDILKDNIVNYFKSNKDNTTETIANHFNVKNGVVDRVLNNYFKLLKAIS